jgi:hypothetical protein
MNLRYRHFIVNPPKSDMKTLDKLIDDFIWRFPRDPGRDTVTLRCKAAKTFPQAVQLATDSIDQRGKMHPHQVKVRKASRDELARLIISRERQVIRFKSFGPLHDLVDSIKPWGVGELTVYDISTRVGWYLGFEPDQLYLHTGARLGWLALVSRFAPDRVAIYKKAKMVDPARFPAPLRRISVDDAEDFLCTYINEFAGLDSL